jgi:hypothetical protein
MSNEPYDLERERTVEGRASRFNCPHCGGEVYFDFVARVKALNVRKFAHEDGDERPAEAQQQLDDLDRYLDSLDGIAVLDAFSQVCQEVKIGSLPKDVRAYFRTWLAAAVPCHLPRFALDEFIGEFGSSKIEYLQAHGIGMVLAGRKIRRFLPNRVIHGQRIQTGTARTTALRVRSAGTPEALEQWTRSRYGYVLGGGAMADALREKSFGAFAGSTEKRPAGAVTPNRARD